MLNKGLNSEEVRSLKTGVVRLMSERQSRHSELDSGSDTWGLELEACSYLSPQKPFAYEACLTRMKNEKLKMKMEDEKWK